MKLFLLRISDFLLQRKFKKTFVYNGVEIDIVSVLTEAKNRLHLKYPNGICIAIANTVKDQYGLALPSVVITEVIPRFNYEFAVKYFRARSVDFPTISFWWEPTDIKSREKYLDYLIKLLG